MMTTSTIRRLVAASALFILGGCTKYSAFGADQVFRHRDFGYRLASAVPARERWRLDNYQLAPDGTPIQPKSTPDYQRSVSVDEDGDGRYERSATLPIYDLLYTSRRSQGRMFLASFPLGARRADTSLSVLARLYVEAVSGAGLEVHEIEGRTAVTERRFAIRILTETDVLLDGVTAREVVFEVANIDQIELDPSARWERARILFARPGLYWNAIGHLDDSSTRMPVLIVMGYSNHPDEYAGEEPDFNAWVGQFRFSPDVSDAARDAVMACRPNVTVVPVISYRNAGNYSSRPSFEVVGASEAEQGCVQRALAHVPRSPVDRSWVFVADDAAPALPTSGGEASTTESDGARTEPANASQSATTDAPAN